MKQTNIKGKELNTPMDIPVGTVLIDSFLNSLVFYKVLKTSAKSVVLQELDFETSADEAGYPYVKVTPVDRPWAGIVKPVRKIVRMLSDGFYIPSLHGYGSLAIWDDTRDYSVYWD